MTRGWLGALAGTAALMLPALGCGDDADPASSGETEPSETSISGDTRTPGTGGQSTQPTPVEGGAVVINEVTSSGADMIEFYNPGTESVNLTGWWYIDDDPANTPYFFPDGLSLAPGEFLVRDKDNHHTFGLGSSDEVNLYNPDGDLVDSTGWSDGEAGVSWCRIPDGTGDFRSCSHATFGARNRDEAEATSPPEGSPVVINEVTSSGADFVEFLNVGDEDVDLTGWSFVDQPEDENEPYFFPDGIVLSPGDRIVRDKDTHFDFGLGGDDAVRLFNADGELVDQTSWVSPQAVISWCRIPDGTGAFRSCGQQRFGQENRQEDPVCGNDEAEWEQACDGDDLRGESCESLGFEDGDLACEADCSAFDISDCESGTVPDCEGEFCVVINEVTSQDDDDVELLNIGTESVDISGWTLIDQPEDENDPWAIPVGTVILPGQYLVFDNAVHFDFGLGNDDAIYLYNASGTLIDFTDWPDRAARGSWCRIPNGTGDFQTCSQRTFGAPNVP